MPRRPSEEPLVKVTLKLFVSDYEDLKRIHGSGNASNVLRSLVRNHLLAVRGSVHLPVEGEEPGEEEPDLVL